MGPARVLLAARWWIGLVGLTTLFGGSAFADVVVRNPYMVREAWITGRLKTSPETDPDTVWIGHVNTVQPGVPGVPGGYGPNKIGRGPHRILGGSLGSAVDYNGTWDFDHFQAGETDSLMGWWPIQAPYYSTQGSNLDDYVRSWFGLDYGNQGNYVIPQGSPKRTFGVMSYWHRDPGSGLAPLPDPDGVPGPNPEWTPIAGAASAWCGLRCDGDNSILDPITGNPFSSAVLSYQGANGGSEFGSERPEGTDHNFPGYGSQWDQLMYRDVAFMANASGNVTLTFKYTTNMSLGLNTDHASQAGWFDKDPLKTPVPGDNNYRSAVFATLVDSFMVYVGAPVDEANCLFSDGTIGPVYDLQRRWFSEVVKINTPGITYRQVLSVAGVHGTPAAPISANLVLTPAQVNAILDADGGAANGGRVRVVFRVKTNRGFDDQNQGNAPPEGSNVAAGGFSSLTRGAAIVDDVAVSGGGATALSNGFESAADVDNSLGVPATAVWKTTGKPPGAWFHVHRVSDLPYDDPAGPIHSPARVCNMTGGVLSPGLHEFIDKPGGVYGSPTQDQQKYVVSPTINLSSTGPGDFNGMGIDAEIASRNPVLVGDVFTNVYDNDITGNTYRFGWQSYPVTQANGAKVWGEVVKSPFRTTFSAPGCYESLLLTPKEDQLVVTSNPSGVPDSFRVYIETIALCFAKPLSSIQCSPSSGVLAGGYFDNLSIGLVDPPTPTVLAKFGHQFQDCFPVNSQNKNTAAFGLPYDTLGARIQSGFNLTPLTGTDLTGPNARENISGDSALASARGPNIRVDLVFRILPGPGNYVTIGNRASGVARRPDQVPRVLASPADAGAALPVASKFWGAYMADNGAFGTSGNGVNGPGHPGGWDPDRWNSARMDTSESNLFPITGLFSNHHSTRLTPGLWMTMYHEADAKYAVLGIDKNRCFFQNAMKPAQLTAARINCGNLSGFPGYPPPIYQVGGVPVAGTGLVASENGLPIGHTFEFTKILPDGQFTPGTEVQYFYRKSTIGDPNLFSMSPDTNYIYPQHESSGYFDGHRWRELRVLPDRWKEPAFAYGGLGMACMLVVDLGERRGDLGQWTAIADSTGLTVVPKRGAHNGWRARPEQNIVSVNVGGDDSIARRDNGGQPGSFWDAYSVIAGESETPSGRLGSRGANRNFSAGSLTLGKWTTHGPSEEMLRNYRIIVVLGADIGEEVFGPLPYQTDNDIGLFQSFLTLPGGSLAPRGLLMQGQRIGEQLSSYHPTFMSQMLRATLRYGNYRALSSNPNPTADLTVVPPAAGVAPATYGMTNTPDIENDVFFIVATAPAGLPSAYYQNVPVGNPYIASVHGPSAGGPRPFTTLLNGWTLGPSGGFGAYPAFASTPAGPATHLLTVGQRKYFADVMTNIFGSSICFPPPYVGVGDGPASVTAFVNFMGLRSRNPMRSGQARIAFTLEKSERARIEVFDLTGRVVRTVADRSFVAGQEHVVIWDGASDAAQRVRSGIYFYRIKTPTWTSQKKLTVLAD